MRSFDEVIPVRSGAVALWLAGPLLTAAVLPHPTILDGDVGGVVQGTAGWGALHSMAALGIGLAWWGVTCTVAVQRAALRDSAGPIFVMASVGATVLIGVMLVEAFAFPVLADRAPGTLEFDGPILGSWTFRLVASLGGAFFVSLVALGLRLARVGVWQGAGRALALTTIVFSIGEGLFVPVLGALSTIALAGAAGWLGLLLWRCTPQGARAPAVGSLR